jgi:Ala-tRNA(Pro) deacylase
MPVQRLKDFLDQNSIQYILISHSRAYTAAAIGAITHIPGKVIAKTVMIKLDGKLAMIVVPGSRHVNMPTLKTTLGVNSALLVSEPEFAEAFPDCEVGAMPPFGSLYGLPVYVDEALTRDEEIAFNAGSHRELMRMKYKDFERLENPTVIDVVKKTTAELERMAG